MLLLILLVILKVSSIDTCPIYCQCYSAFDGYHVICQNAKLYEIPLNLTRFLQTTNHQNIIVDLSSNFLSIIPCYFFQISTIITLILTKNHIEYIPLCFSQSSIENLFLNNNYLKFNQTTILSSSKLLHLDISSNQILSLPRTFFSHIRRLKRLIINNENNLFQLNNDQWIRSLTTHNQLTIIICNENFHLPLCLLDYLFQTNKLLAIELNHNIHCDCSLVFLPIEKIHFHYCQSEKQQGICNIQSSRFEQGHSLIYLQSNKYRQICAQEYQTCRIIPTTEYNQLVTDTTTNDYKSSSIKNFLRNESITTTSTINTITLSKKENITAGAIISFVLVLLIVTVVCLYVILSGHLFKMNNRQRTTDLMVKNKKQQNMSSVNSNGNPTRFDECIPIDNINMNSNPEKNSFRSYHQRTSSCSDDECDLTFYSINNTTTNHSSTSFIQTSMTEIEIASSSTSTIDSSLSNETIIISNRNKQRI